MWTAESLSLIVLTFVLAGFVKGVVGLGLPTVSLAILTVFLGLHPAMGLLLVPSFVTNLWQAMVGGQATLIWRRSWLFLVSATVCIWLGVQILAGGDASTMARVLGLLLVAYSALGLTRPPLSVGKTQEAWLGPVAGSINGVFTGMTGSFVVPGVLYLQALGMPRDMLVQAMGILFTLSTVGLALALGQRQMLPADLLVVSTAAVIPAIAGMYLGQRIRQNLSEVKFRTALFVALLIIGIYIVVR